MSFDTFCEGVARKFIQTVMVVDDRARLTDYAAPAPVTTVNRPAGRGYSGGTPATPTSPAQASSPLPEQTVAVPAATAPSVPVSSVAGEGHDLDGMSLTRSFAKLGVACSIYVPETNATDPAGPASDPGAEDVDDTARIARHADVVVLDWNLGTNSNKTRRILRRIVSEDARENGRLRLIAVYTGVRDLESLRNDVKSDLAKEGQVLANVTEADVLGLSQAGLRIVFLNKSHVRGQVLATVSEAELPERLVKEFARMSRGIVPAVALGSITAVRNNTHHVLARFHAGLDGALATHRSMLVLPEDAEGYATDLVADELRAVLEVSEVGAFHAGMDAFDLWAQSRHDTGHRFLAAPDAKKGLDVPGVSRLLRLGLEEHANVAGSVDPKVSTRRKFASYATGFFYGSKAEADAANLEFSRMAALRREAYGNSSLPRRWRPTMTLGTVVMRQDSSSAVFACIQPVCDAVRITNVRRFPMVPLRRMNHDKTFSLVLRLADRCDHGFEPDYRPYNLVHETFVGDLETATVRACREGTAMMFEAADGCRYEWLADLKGFVAMRLIQRSAGQVDRVGLDEYEWLRLKAQGKVD